MHPQESPNHVQERHVLDAIYQNAAMGLDATSTILRKANHPKLRAELCKQLTYYQDTKDQIRSQLASLHAQPLEKGELAKLCANASIQLHCLDGASSSEIAALMCKGTNTGVVQLTQVLHQNPDISESLKRQSRAIIRHEEAYMQRLKPYL